MSGLLIHIIQSSLACSVKSPPPNLPCSTLLRFEDVALVMNDPCLRHWVWAARVAGWDLGRMGGHVWPTAGATLPRLNVVSSDYNAYKLSYT